jgi:hypothetical protein
MKPVNIAHCHHDICGFEFCPLPYERSRAKIAENHENDLIWHLLVIWDGYVFIVNFY